MSKSPEPIVRHRIVAIAFLAAFAVLVGPAVSASAETATTVTAQHVGAASAKKTVPDVVGKTAYNAKKTLKKAGLKYKYKTPAFSFVVLSKNWTVIKQSPKAGSKV